ncbi:MAG: hypothetical protein SVV03_00365 [Candidatus Nanohaloarchaea archaeon]|nr:hypothetical protein [Candidatus Nanohaloarchaea archaeon]
MVGPRQGTPKTGFEIHECHKTLSSVSHKAEGIDHFRYLKRSKISPRPGEVVKTSHESSESNRFKLDNPIVLVHGYGDVSWSSWWTRHKELLHEYDPAVDIYQVDFGAEISLPFSDRRFSVPATSVGSVKDNAERLKEFVGSLEEDTVDVIAHSQGGIDARYYVEKLDGDEKVDNLVMLGSPHQGTYTAYLAFFTAGARDLRPGSQVLEDLNDELLEKVNYIALWGSRDWIVCPNRNGRLPDHLVENNDNARNEKVDVGHTGVITRREAMGKYIRDLVEDG